MSYLISGSRVQRARKYESFRWKQRNSPKLSWPRQPRSLAPASWSPGRSGTPLFEYLSYNIIISDLWALYWCVVQWRTSSPEWHMAKFALLSKNLPHPVHIFIKNFKHAKIVLYRFWRSYFWNVTCQSVLRRETSNFHDQYLLLLLIKAWEQNCENIKSWIFKNVFVWSFVLSITMSDI